MFQGVLPQRLEEGFTTKTSVRGPTKHSDIRSQHTSSQHSVSPKHRTATPKLPIALISTKSQSRGMDKSHLRNMVHFKRRLAFHIEVSVPVQLVEFAHNNLSHRGSIMVLSYIQTVGVPGPTS